KLVNEGYVYRKRGIGTIVSKNDGVSKNGEIKSVSKIKNKKPLIGLIVTSFDGSFGNTLITSVEEASEDKCFIILKRSDSNPAKEDKIINELIEFGVDGLIILPAHAEHYNFEILKMVVNQFPLILIDR